MSWDNTALIGPGPSCVYCGEGYGGHTEYCPEMEKRRWPRRFRVPCGGKHPSGTAALYRYGCYFPLTDLVVGDMGGQGTGEPKDVEWLDPPLHG